MLCSSCTLNEAVKTFQFPTNLASPSQQSVRLMNDNYCISELFNMLKLEGACRRANRCAFLNGDWLAVSGWWWSDVMFLILSLLFLHLRLHSFPFSFMQSNQGISYFVPLYFCIPVLPSSHSYVNIAFKCNIKRVVRAKAEDYSMLELFGVITSLPETVILRRAHIRWWCEETPLLWHSQLFLHCFWLIKINIYLVLVLAALANPKILN